MSSKILCLFEIFCYHFAHKQIFTLKSFLFFISCLHISTCIAVDTGVDEFLTEAENQNSLNNKVKRGAISKCSSREECDMILPGSLCLNETCICPQGFLPNSAGAIGCFQTGKLIGESCNISAQCGEDLSCSRHICVCPEGLQHINAEGTNFCLLWHRPARLERCRSYEDCTPLEPNSICRKHWCQCNNGFQLFQTMLFGLRHKCFKTYKKHCHSPHHCSKLSQTSNQYCVCHFGYCHCTPNSNATALDIYRWMNEKPSWVEIWKRDMIIALRLMSMTAVLFFVPCLVYLILGLTGRRRLMFFRIFCPSLNTQYAERRNAEARRRNSNSVQRRNSNQACRRNSARNAVEPRNVVIALGAHGIDSRLVNDANAAAAGNVPVASRTETAFDTGTSQKQADDSLPTYDEVMKQDQSHEAPPPSYNEL